MIYAFFGSGASSIHMVLLNYQHNHLTFIVEKGILRPEWIILGTPGIVIFILLLAMQLVHYYVLGHEVKFNAKLIKVSN